jgi:hypothetical protein
MDLSAPAHTLSGIDGSQAFNLVQVYADQIVHSAVPIGAFTETSRFGDRFLRGLATMTPEQRVEAFSSKSSTATIAEVEALGDAD